MPDDMLPLEQALRTLERAGDFNPDNRIWWITARNIIEGHLKYMPRDYFPELHEAIKALDMPERLNNEAELWEEMRHQLVVAVGG